MVRDGRYTFTMRSVPLLIVVVIAGCVSSRRAEVPAPVRAKGFDPTFYGGPPAPECREIVLASVERVFDGPATTDHPPRVKLFLHEVLRGELRPGSIITAVWSGPPHEFADTIPQNEEEHKRWADVPIGPPSVGSKFLLAGSIWEDEQGRVLIINPAGKIPFTPKNRRDVIDQLAARDKAKSSHPPEPES
jgi:hypothetical protein